MSAGDIGYVSFWTMTCIYAVYLLIKYRASFAVFRRVYYDYLFHKWKIITFCIAWSAFVVIAPYTGDPTWDYIDASFMSILTFFISPWTVATLYLSMKRKVNWRVTYVAICAWLFTAS